jgi:hypothetical protein
MSVLAHCHVIVLDTLTVMAPAVATTADVVGASNPDNFQCGCRSSAPDIQNLGNRHGNDRRPQQDEKGRPKYSVHRLSLHPSTRLLPDRPPLLCNLHYRWLVLEH